jgi:hypothetical protein
MLGQWERTAFSDLFDYVEILPDKPPQTVIRGGEVLDTYNRPKWALDQMQQLVSFAEASPEGAGKIWFSDFFTPGLEALPYTRTKFKAFSFLWAQTFDRYDFTNRFIPWMRPWETSALKIYTKVFVASHLLRDLIVTALPDAEARVEVVGLPFDSSDVLSRISGGLPESRMIDVVYSSRFDQEKNPNFFLDLVSARPDLNFAICTGHPRLQGSDSDAVKRAEAIASSKGNLQIYVSLQKGDYYRVLASSKIQFNCALQDWTSFTFLEALTYGCLPLYPNWRDFPMSVYDMRYLYQMGNLESANLVLERLLSAPPKDYNNFRAETLNFHDRTLATIAKHIHEA